MRSAGYDGTTTLLLPLLGFGFIVFLLFQIYRHLSEQIIHRDQPPDNRITHVRIIKNENLTPGEEAMHEHGMRIFDYEKE